MPTLVAGIAWMVFHLGSVCDPMHPNLARATLIGGEKKLESYAWSSCAESLKIPKKRPEWLKTVRLRDADCTQTRKRSDSDAQRGCLSAARWELEIPCECAFQKCVNMNDRPIDCVSGVAGVIVPTTLKRFGADPATASSIFLTTATDVVSMGAFLGLATLLLL